MDKIFYTQECDFCSKENDSEFALIKLEEQSEHPSFFEDKSHIIFSLEQDVTVVFDSGETVNLPARHLYHIKKGSKYSLHAKSAAEVLILTFSRIDYYCRKRKYVSRVDENIIFSENVKPQVLLMEYPLVNFTESVRYYLNASLLCPFIQDLKRKELSILFKELYTYVQIESIILELYSNSKDFKSQIRYYLPKIKTVNEFAQLCGYSRKTFERMFKEHFGMNPSQMILRQKKEKTLAMLADSNIPIKVIVANLGFASASHLNTFCRKEFGVTPSVLREELAKRNS